MRKFCLLYMASCEGCLSKPLNAGHLCFTLQRLDMCTSVPPLAHPVKIVDSLEV